MNPENDIKTSGSVPTNGAGVDDVEARHFIEAIRKALLPHASRRSDAANGQSPDASDKQTDHLS
jgi:hypothetical protein